ncbi:MULTISPECIES: HAD-IA family hydrolase [unclassified Lentilitoribacter]|jgi:putative hydrolase of the HAD superfamily|uniref:HAD-IA family hydrolase n=1 Tax=unclassified Lentilitoribacter TaxID=2647570 RepID=UPI0013A6D0CB|nr:HAD-IA family hydrolase [Lentilitoribacter sp. Alg239-R112]
MSDKALILDFGGVISRTLFETHDITEKALGLPSGSLTWMGPFDQANDPLWLSMQNDEISERDYWKIRTQEVAHLTNQNWSEMSDFVKAARGADPSAVIRPEFLETLASVKKAGIRTAILSNELDLFYGAGFRNKLPFLFEIDVIHDATYTKNLKPSPTAYTNILDELGLSAGACVFVDDQVRNITGAQTVGLPTVQFDVKKPRQSYQEALSLLGLI